MSEEQPQDPAKRTQEFRAFAKRREADQASGGKSNKGIIVAVAVVVVIVLIAVVAVLVL